MLRLDTWQEILDTVRKNKLRTVLTGFSVAWGILILVVLLGSGQGLAHGVEYGFRDDAINSIWMRSGQTSRALQGPAPGAQRAVHQRRLRRVIRDGVAGVEHITARFFIRGNLTVAYGSETGELRRPLGAPRPPVPREDDRDRGPLPQRRSTCASTARWR